MQRPGARGGSARRPAAIPRQRPDRHRHRPHVQRHPGSVAGPGGLPRQGPVRPVLADHRALPDRGYVRRPHRLRHPGPGPCRHRHQLAAAADRRRGPAARLGARGLRRAHRAAPAGRLRPQRSHLRQHLDQARGGTARIGRPRPARAAGQSRPDRRRRRVDRLRPRPDRRASHRRTRRIRRRTSPTPRLGGPRVSQDGAVRNGWLDTGDLGSVDAGGFVYLTGRAKDLIIRGGHNIDPRTIEDALLRHPAIRAAAAVGRPDRHSGEVPVAYVVPASPGPVRRDRTARLGRAPPSASPPPGPSTSTRSTPSRSPRWASISNPRWPPTPLPAP